MDRERNVGPFQKYLNVRIKKLTKNINPYFYLAAHKCDTSGTGHSRQRTNLEIPTQVSQNKISQVYCFGQVLIFELS